MLIGIVGLTDSGKDQILKIIIDSNKNNIIINTLKIYSLLLNNSFFIAELIKIFGKNIIDKNRSITMNSLNHILLQGSEDIQKLHEIITKYSEKIIQNIQSEHPKQTNIIIDIGSLLNFGIYSICDKIIVTVATKQTRAKRLSERTNISYDEALKRVSIQRKLSYDKDNCKYIDTDKNITEETKQDLLNFIKK